MRNTLQRLGQNKLKIFATIAAIIVVALIFLFAIINIAGRKLNDNEQAALDQLNQKVLFYIDELESENETDELEQEAKFVIFAMTYSYEEDDKTELTPKEINDIIHSYFDTDIDLNEVLRKPLQPYLENKNIIFLPEDGKVLYKPATRAKKGIAQTPITVYLQKEARIKNSTITSTYSKYTVDDPYNIFTSATSLNMDTTGIGAYLNGNGKEKSIKRLVTPENVNDIAKNEGDFKLTIIVKDEKLLIKL